MAGRPKMMAKRVRALEEQALSLSADVYKTTPQYYLEKPNRTPICIAWNTAVDAVMGASLALEQLGDILRLKAGITEPGPSQRLLSEQSEDLESEPVDGGGDAEEETETESGDSEAEEEQEEE